jgi:hypothetical protein
VRRWNRVSLSQVKSGVPIHRFIEDSGKNRERDFRNGKSRFLARHLGSEIMDKPTLAILALAVVIHRDLVDVDGLSRT